ncbi:MAG: hypothetical protein WAW59_05900 [Patescibacteria group bacterium]
MSSPLGSPGAFTAAIPERSTSTSNPSSFALFAVANTQKSVASQTILSTEIFAVLSICSSERALGATSNPE